LPENGRRPRRITGIRWFVRIQDKTVLGHDASALLEQVIMIRPDCLINDMTQGFAKWDGE
jgi:hypothetical protein